MERQVPAIMLMAESMSVQLRSGIFCSAILRTSSLLMVATLSLGNAGSGLDAACLLDEQSGRRSLGDEGKAAVRVHGDDDRDHHTHIALGALVEVLGELTDVNAVLTQCEAYRGSRVALPAGAGI